MKRGMIAAAVLAMAGAIACSEASAQFVVPGQSGAMGAGPSYSQATPVAAPMIFAMPSAGYPQVMTAAPGSDPMLALRLSLLEFRVASMAEDRIAVVDRVVDLERSVSFDERSVDDERSADLVSDSDDRAEIDNLRQQIVRAQAEIDSLVRELQESREEVSDLVSAIDDLRSIAAELRALRTIPAPPPERLP